MRKAFWLFLLISFPSFCQRESPENVEIYEYMQLKANDDTASISIGTVSHGSLKHGKLIPFFGDNYRYFDRDSYLAGRAFLNGAVKNTLLQSYDSLYRVLPSRLFQIMECANEEGGELFPHKTHQNGMSVDLMMPLIQNNEPYYGLDDLGAEHYALSFDDQGRYLKDLSISIDFNLVALELLIIDYFAKSNGIQLSKVIIKIELKDELFATEFGQILKAQNIYIVQGLSPIINDLHDDHFHLDFEFPYPTTAPEKRVK